MWLLRLALSAPDFLWAGRTCRTERLQFCGRSSSYAKSPFRSWRGVGPAFCGWPGSGILLSRHERFLRSTGDIRSWPAACCRRIDHGGRSDAQKDTYAAVGIRSCRRVSLGSSVSMVPSFHLYWGSRAT